MRRNRIDTSPRRKLRWAGVLLMLLGVLLLATGVLWLLLWRHVIYVPPKLQNLANKYLPG